MAQWLACRPPELDIPGSSPGVWFMFFLGALSRRSSEEMGRRGDGAMGTLGERRPGVRASDHSAKRPSISKAGSLARNNGQRWAAGDEPRMEGGRWRKPNRTSGGWAEGCRDRPDDPTLSATLVALGPLSVFLSHVYQVVSFRCQASAWHTPPLPMETHPHNESHLLASS